jgi:hypothetical protein
MRRSALLATLCIAGPACAGGVFFDDFSYRDAAQLAAGGWSLRGASGHPGVPGARWAPDAITLVDDPARAGNRLLRLSARTDGTGEGTQQAQLCHQRKVLAGTYAARVRFTDTPVQGIDGDPVVQAYYAVSPLRHDFDPQFSEIDWEYLPNGGWGSERTRLYGISWQTVRVEPWEAHNQAHEEWGSWQGWHTLVMQVAEGRSHWYVDGRKVAEHGGRNHPVVPMAIAFSLWFSPGGLLPPSAVPRVYEQDVDWVFHAQDSVLSPAQVDGAVTTMRQRGMARIDTVPPAQPPLDSRCDF